MAHIPGKYKLAENKNYYELLLKVGVPEDHAKAANEEKSTVQIEVNGNKIRYTNEENVADLVVNEETEEKFRGGIIAKSTTKLAGNVITVDSITPDHIVKRVYTFTAPGLEERLVITKGDVTAEATRTFKRV